MQGSPGKKAGEALGSSVRKVLGECRKHLLQHWDRQSWGQREGDNIPPSPPTLYWPSWLLLPLSHQGAGLLSLPPLPSTIAMLLNLG